GLENRYPSQGGSRVQIPPPPSLGPRKGHAFGPVRWEGGVDRPPTGCHLKLTPPLENVSTGIAPTWITVSWNCCVARLTQTLTSTFMCWPPSMIRRAGPEKLAIEPVTKPFVGVACTFMMCSRPKAPRTNDDRPAIR